MPFLGTEGAAEHRLCAEHVEEVHGDAHTGHLFRLAHAGDGPAAALHDGIAYEELLQRILALAISRASPAAA